MKIGGYQIIDLKGKNLTTDVGMVYEGIYELIEGTRKPILLSGIQVDDTEYQDVFTSVSINGSAFELKAYNKIFTIEDTDVVTVTNDISDSNGDNVDTLVIDFNDNFAQGIPIDNVSTITIKNVPIYDAMGDISTRITINGTYLGEALDKKIFKINDFILVMIDLGSFEFAGYYTIHNLPIENNVTKEDFNVNDTYSTVIGLLIDSNDSGRKIQSIQNLVSVGSEYDPTTFIITSYLPTDTKNAIVYYSDIYQCVIMQGEQLKFIHSYGGDDARRFECGRHYTCVVNNV